eukprot:SAG31_NODE_3937_length_3736_cov_1.195766_2_plen_153_part_00
MKTARPGRGRGQKKPGKPAKAAAALSPADHVQKHEEEERMHYDKGVPPQQLEELREMFDLFDEDGSGSIGAEELLHAMVALGFDEASESAPHRITKFSNLCNHPADCLTKLSSITSAALLPCSGVRETKRKHRQGQGRRNRLQRIRESVATT